MAFGVIGAVTEAMMYGPEGMDYASMSIAGVDPSDPSKLLLKERTFQYWPEAISDSIEVGWNFKDIPGMSHALAQWASNGGRTITFEVSFSRLMKPVASRNTFEKVLDPFEANTPTSEYLKDNRPYNVDIVAEIKYLRAFCYPSYKEIEGYMTAYPPPVAMLSVPNLGLGDVNGNNIIYAVMTGCDVTYVLLFPDGTPRRATVALTFRQVIQDPQEKSVYLVGHPDNYSFYPASGDEGLAAGGAREKNGVGNWKGGPV